MLWGVDGGSMGSLPRPANWGICSESGYLNLTGLKRICSSDTERLESHLTPPNHPSVEAEGYAERATVNHWANPNSPEYHWRPLALHHCHIHTQKKKKRRGGSPLCWGMAGCYDIIVAGVKAVSVGNCQGFMGQANRGEVHCDVLPPSLWIESTIHVCQIQSQGRN